MYPSNLYEITKLLASRPINPINIESSERTIGIAQARGAYTQVLGIKL